MCCFQPGRSPLGPLCWADKYRFNYTHNKNITFMSKNTSKITYNPSTRRSQTEWKISGIYQESWLSLPNKIQARLIHNDLSEVSLTSRERHKSSVRVDTTNYMPWHLNARRTVGHDMRPKRHTEASITLGKCTSTYVNKCVQPRHIINESAGNFVGRKQSQLPIWCINTTYDQ